jgi:Tfp pilus assembly protein PilF
MSLLLEALKKAELAKQGALGTAPQAEELDVGGIRFEEPEEPVRRPDPAPAFAEPVLEPVVESGVGFSPEPEPVPMPEPEPVAAAPRPARPAPPPEPDVVSPPPSPNPQRVAARQMFEAKEVNYNPKRPFYITLGVLGFAAVGYGVYLWWQLQPKYAVNTAAIQNAPKSSPITKPAPLPPPPVEPAATAEAETPGAATPADGKPAAAPVAAAEPAVQPAPAPQTAGAAAPVVATPTRAAAPKSERTAAAAPVASAAAPARSSRPVQGATPPSAPGAQVAGTAQQNPPAPRAPRLPIKVTPPAFQGNQVLEDAYSAFQRGELDRARNDYQQVLSREPNNRDALLGLAAIDVRTRNYETAELRYLKLLEMDPRDINAHAALIALQGNVDPVQLESRIKNLIAAQPDATHLYFTLGNQYAAQMRWAEAQDAYFKAYTGDAENADFAFNLAVSLDHLRQRRLAAEYYRKSVTLAGTRAVGFDRNRAEARARELER